MPLTHRQSALLEKLIDLYTAEHQPIHYTVVAQRLGVRNTTAYEMLKLLEREGYVTSQYILSGTAGPGRSSVVFVPTARADALFRGLVGDHDGDAEWETVKQQILPRLGEGEVVEQALLEELVSRLSEAEHPLVYCAKVLTALFLNLGREARQRLQQQEIVRQLATSSSSARSTLGLLPGLALGLALLEPARQFSGKLISFSQVCQARLQQLDDANLTVLADFLRQELNAMRDLTDPEEQDRHATLP